jgi:hypothetical protein
VPEHVLDLLDLDTLLVEQGGAPVSEIMKADPTEAGPV